MKFRGKTITNSSILLVLGVLCFATILVSASVLLSSISWSNSVVNPYEYTQIDVSTKDFSGQSYENIPADNEQAIKDKPYVFGIQVTANEELVSGSLTITVATTTGDAAAILRYWNGATWTDISPSGSGKTLTFTHALTTSLADDETIDFQLTYGSVDTYTVSVSLNKA